MNRSFYLALHNYVLSHPLLTRAVRLSTKLLTGIVYLTYPAMLVFLLFTAPPQLVRGILVPLAGFVICALVRAKINAPRPYEALDIPAITKKDTQGKSFPSRHSACAAVIAVTALALVPPLGVILLIVSLLIVITRILSGVHFIRDVICGWLLSAVIGYIGMYLIY